MPQIQFERPSSRPLHDNCYLLNCGISIDCLFRFTNKQDVDEMRFYGCALVLLHTHTQSAYNTSALDGIVYTGASIQLTRRDIVVNGGVRFGSISNQRMKCCTNGAQTIVFSTSTRWTRPIDSWNSLVCYTLLRFKYWTSILRTLIGSWCRLPLSIQKFCTYARQQWQPKHENTEEQEIYCNDIFDDSLAWRWNLELKTILFAPKNTCAVFFHLQKCYIIFVSTVLNRTAATRAKFGVLCSWECSSELMSIAAVRPRHIHTRTQCPLQMVY